MARSMRCVPTSHVLPPIHPCKNYWQACLLEKPTQEGGQDRTCLCADSTYSVVKEACFELSQVIENRELFELRNGGMNISKLVRYHPV